MPSIDENFNTMNGDSLNEFMMDYNLCNCCPFGYHIDRDFVPFSEKMLSREGNVERIQELKDKWRSERQSMDKLLGVLTECLNSRTSSRQSYAWRKLYKASSIIPEILQYSPQDDGSENFTFGTELDEAVEEFEEVLSRTKREHNMFTFPDEQKFHTFPRLKGSGRDTESYSKCRGLMSIATETTYHYMANKEENGRMSSASDPSSIENETSINSGIFGSSSMEKQIAIILEEKLKSVNQLEAKVYDLTLENEKYKKLLNNETVMNFRLDRHIDSSYSDMSEGMMVLSKLKRDVGVGTTVLTRDVAISAVKPRTRSIGVGGRADTGSLERDSSSPTGSLTGRRRSKTFESGVQVNESDLEKCLLPPLLLITEKNDFGAQVDLGITTEDEKPILKLMKHVGINVKPSLNDYGVNCKPRTRDAICNTLEEEILGSNSDRITQLSKDSGDASNTSRIPETCLKTVGVNTFNPEFTSVGSSTINPMLRSVGSGTISRLYVNAESSTSTLFTKNSSFVQTDKPEMVTVATQQDVDCLISKASQTIERRTGVNVSGSMSVESLSRIPRRNANSHMSSYLYSADSESLPRLPRQSIYPKPVLMRSNTYTKEILLEEDEEVTGFESEHLVAHSFDLSIPTIPEHQETSKPSKEMRGALKVLNDALLRGKATGHVTNAIGIILHEWFRTAGLKSADAHEVEEYLDLFESYSPELLKYIVNMPDGNGNSAINYAMSHGNFDVISFLLDSNCCDINRTNRAGYTCVMLLSLVDFSAETDVKVARRLCSMADVNIKATQHGQTALMLAASHGSLDTCKILLEAGADVNIQDDDGSTALMCAAEHGHVQLVHFFILHPECDLHIADNDGARALEVALDAGHKDLGVTLYAHMHLVESPKVRRKLLSTASIPQSSSVDDDIPNSPTTLLISSVSIPSPSSKPSTGETFVTKLEKNSISLDTMKFKDDNDDRSSTTTEEI